MKPRLRREGRGQAIAALAVAAAFAGLVVGSSDIRVAAGLVIAGYVVLLTALSWGSARLVGMATLPMLGGALAASTAGAQPAWALASILGILWYLAAELAWDSIERRDGGRRSTALIGRRIDETATVVVMAFGIAAAGLAASAWTPVRTMAVVVTAVGAVLTLMVWGTRRLRASAEEPQ